MKKIIITTIIAALLSLCSIAQPSYMSFNVGSSVNLNKNGLVNSTYHNNSPIPLKWNKNTTAHSFGLSFYEWVGKSFIVGADISHTGVITRYNMVFDTLKGEEPTKFKTNIASILIHATPVLIGNDSTKFSFGAGIGLGFSYVYINENNNISVSGKGKSSVGFNAALPVRLSYSPNKGGAVSLILQCTPQLNRVNMYDFIYCPVTLGLDLKLR